MPSIISAGTTTGTALSLTSDTSGELQIQTNNGSTTAMTLTTGGNVGIGTTTPLHPLDIRSNFVSQVTIGAISGNTNANLNFEPTGTGVATVGPAGAFPFVFRTDAVERMRITSTGNVGIGTSSPNQTLVVKTADGGGIAYENAAGKQWRWAVGSGSEFALTESAVAERMRIDSSGNVGIGTNNPQQLLDLYGSGGLTLIQIQGSAGICGYFGGANTSGSGVLTSVPRDMVIRGEGSNILFSFSNVEAARINANANFVLKGGSTGATGIGITFPAAQSASSDANCLDDYEEGTWTPTITMASGTSTGSSGDGTYVKIGRQVTVTVGLAVGTISAGGEINTINGLPFTARAGNDQAVGLSRENANTGFGWELRANSSDTSILVRKVQDNSAQITTGMVFIGTVTYFTTS